MKRADLKQKFGTLAFALLLLVIFSLGLMKPALSPPASLTPTDVIFPFLLLAWLVALAAGVERFRWHRAYWAFGAYFLALAISTVFSTDAAVSVRKLPGEFYLIVLAVVAANLVTTVARLRLAVLAWLAGAVIPLVAGIAAITLFYLTPESPLLDHLTHHYGAVPVGNFPRISSTFVSASMLCNYLTVTAMLVLIAKRMRWIGSLAASVAISVVVIASAFTVSIALGGLALALGLWIHSTVQRESVRRLGLVAGCIGAAGFIAIAPFALSLPANAPYTFHLPFVGTVAPSPRLLVWADALQTFASHPLTGKGLETGAASILYKNSEGTTSLLTDAHNMVLNVAAQAGVLGLLGLAGLVFAMTRSSLAKGTGDLYVVRTGLAIALICAFLYDGLTGSFENARHLWMLFGLILAVERLHTDQGCEEV